MCPGDGEMERCSGVFRDQHNPSKINPKRSDLSRIWLLVLERAATHCSAIYVRRATHGSAIRAKSHPWQSCFFSCSVQCMSEPSRCFYHLKENAYVCSDRAFHVLDTPCYTLQSLRVDGLLQNLALHLSEYLVTSLHQGKRHIANFRIKQ